jgi:[acyl-carrier-protein] S-malonyltransferase
MALHMSKFAFVFPGQGSQAPGMLDAWNGHPAVKAVLAEASDALGEDIGALIASGSKETLALTTNTQPAMLVAGVAAWAVWKAEGGPDPAFVAGHSLGEYAALVAAETLTLRQAAPLVRLRAQAMQDAVPVGAGAMSAVLGLAADRVIAVCQEVTQTLQAQADHAHEVVEAVNFNDPGQTVIAGSKLAVEQSGVALKAAGAKRALPLPVSAPFHSSLMRPAAEKLAVALAGLSLQAPRIPVINNIDVATPDDAAAIQDALVRQAYGPVQWVRIVHSLKAAGVSTVVECGPGKVLSGMVKRIDADLAACAVYDPATLTEVRTLLGVSA